MEAKCAGGERLGGFVQIFCLGCVRVALSLIEVQPLYR